MKNKIISVLHIAIVASTIYTFVFLVHFATVVGDSMRSNYFNNQLLFVTMYDKSEITNNDVIVIWSEGLNEYIVKRVIAKGGDTLMLSSTDVYVNGKEQSRGYINEPDNTRYNPIKKFTVPQGYYFVMGDNRNYSTDSRSKVVGLVSNSAVYGRVKFNITKAIGVSSSSVKVLCVVLIAVCAVGMFVNRTNDY